MYRFIQTVSNPDIPLSPEGIPSNRIQEIVHALLPQVYHAINAGYVDPNKLRIMGHSYGGYETAAVISQTNLFRAAVAMSGAYDLPGTYGLFDNTFEYPTFYMSWSEHGQGGMGALPWDNLQRYLDNSPYYQVSKI